MKKRIVCTLIMTMMLCGCSDDEVHQKPSRPSSAVTTTAAAEVTTEASQEEAAATTTVTAAAETSAETTTTTAAADTSSDTVVTEIAPEENNAAADAAGSHASLVLDDHYAGLYIDENNGLFTMTIDNINDAEYKVTISRKISENQSIRWYITGQFDGRAVLHYNNCSKSILTASAADGSVSSETTYTGGTGYIAISERGDATGMVWSDDVDNSGSGAFFIK